MRGWSDALSVIVLVSYIHNPDELSIELVNDLSVKDLFQSKDALQSYQSSETMRLSLPHHEISCLRSASSSKTNGMPFQFLF